VTIASFGFMGICSWMIWPVAYVVFLFIGQLALNVVFAAQCGLPADLQGVSPDEEGVEGSKENGVVSGAVALHSFVGSLVAMSIVIATREMPVQIEYPIYMLKLAIVLVVVCMSATESPTHKQEKAVLSLADLMRSYSIDPKRDIDFLWVCVGRMFYYVSTSSVVFIKYYLRDMLHINDESTLRFRLGVVVISAQLIGAVFSIPFSRLSNTWGRKKVIYLACAIMTCTFALYIAAPRIGAEGSWPLVLVAALCHGAGSGAYLSVDYALALDTLPAGKTTAEAFGLWGVAGFIGATVGPMVGGGLLSAAQVSDRNGGEYGFWGYAIVMFTLGCAMNLFVVIFTRKILKAK
jgi:MFS-type transporter involved in bile tolerance (Atg22 family)